jgi:uncharacterized protein
MMAVMPARRLRLLLPVLACAGCADTLLLHPSSDPRDTPASRGIVDFENGALEVWKLRAKNAPGGEPELFVLSFIGNGDRAEARAVAEADLWRDRPAEIWAVNYPGYGGSTGPARLSRIAPAALAAFDEIHSVAAGRPVLVSGNSLGTTAALHVAAHRPVGGLVLRDPPPLRGLIMGRYGWWNLWLAAGLVALQVPSELDSLSNGAHVHAPAIFILSSRDRVVPPPYQRDVVDAYAGEKTIVPLEGGHHKGLTPEARERLSDALRRLEAEARREN